MPDRKTQLVGMAAVSCIVFFWSSWLVASRSGTLAGLTIWDITAFRYAIAGLLSLPIILVHRPWRSLTLGRTAALALTGGVPYAVVSYVGFIYAPAAHGGIFLNGFLPILTMIIGFLWLRERPLAMQVVGGVLILAGASMASISTGIGEASNSWIGDLVFLFAGLMFAVFMQLQRRWHTDYKQILYTTSVIGMVVYVPVWWLLLPSTLESAAPQQIAVQAFFQGMFPNFLGLILLSIAVRRIGPTVSAAFLSAVPGVGTVFALIVLGENPALLGWLGLPILTAGILLATLWQRRA